MRKSAYWGKGLGGRHSTLSKPVRRRQAGSWLGKCWHITGLHGQLIKKGQQAQLWAQRETELSLWICDYEKILNLTSALMMWQNVQDIYVCVYVNIISEIGMGKCWNPSLGRFPTLPPSHPASLLVRSMDRTLEKVTWWSSYQLWSSHSGYLTPL